MRCSSSPPTSLRLLAWTVADARGATIALEKALALTVGSGGQHYAIPRSYVEEIVFGSSDHVEFAQAGARRLVTFRGKRVPCLSLGEILGAEEAEGTAWESKEQLAEHQRLQAEAKVRCRFLPLRTLVELNVLASCTLPLFRS